MTLPFRTVTFIFTDIKGSTKLAQGNTELARLSSNGHTMTVEQAIALALEE